MIVGNAIRFAVEPRDVPLKKAARRLHLTEAQFMEKLPHLYARGFPRPDATTGMFDLKQIDFWMDQRHDRSQPVYTTENGSLQTPRERIQAITNRRF